MFGLWRRRAYHPSTRVALSLLQLGYLDKAQVRHRRKHAHAQNHSRQWKSWQRHACHIQWCGAATSAAQCSGPVLAVHAVPDKLQQAVGRQSTSFENLRTCCFAKRSVNQFPLWLLLQIMFANLCTELAQNTIKVCERQAHQRHVPVLVNWLMTSHRIFCCVPFAPLGERSELWVGLSAEEPAHSTVR